MRLTVWGHLVHGHEVWSVINDVINDVRKFHMFHSPKVGLSERSHDQFSKSHVKTGRRSQLSNKCRSTLSLQLRHWRDDFDLILTDRDVSMHSIIISQKQIYTVQVWDNVLLCSCLKFSIAQVRHNIKQTTATPSVVPHRDMTCGVQSVLVSLIHSVLQLPTNIHFQTLPLVPYNPSHTSLS